MKSTTGRLGKFSAFAAAMSIVFAVSAQPKVTLESLLDEMCDADAATRLPESSWTGRLWSSYDRRSAKPDDSSDGWFANNDWSQWLRVEKNGGRDEGVMVEAEGPGVVTRIWTANGRGTVVRIYMDGASEPTWEGLATNFTFGTTIPFPLQNSVSPLVEPRHRAYNCYLPVPYAKSVKITAELGRDDKRFWYNIETRTYGKDCPSVESLSPAVLKRAGKAIGDACSKLVHPELEESEPPTAYRATLKTNLAPGECTRVEITDGPRAICGLPGLPEGDIRLRISFDGEETVNLPRPLFIKNGLAAAQFPMPFASNAVVVVENAGTGTLDISKFAVLTRPYAWDNARSMHFGAYGFEKKNLPTRKGKAGYYELNWLRLAGEGRIAGHSLVIDNHANFKKGNAWWGEGDEKICVDGEAFPSYFGTGTEDFFGYAWGPNRPYDALPFLAMPETDGQRVANAFDKFTRRTSVFRSRRLDAIPFSKSLALDVEVWHWQDTTMDYVPATFWYARPGVRVSGESKRPAAFGDRWRESGERILFYGDSITHGGRFIVDLQLFESVRHPGSHVRFLNGGRSGGSAWTGLKNLDREIAESRPDRIVVMFGMNDIGRDLWKSEAPDGNTLCRRRKKLSDYRKNMAELVRRIRSKNIACVLMTPSPYDQYSDIPVANISHCNDLGLAAAAQIVRDLAATNRLALIELHEPMTRIFAASKEPLCGDRVHPGEQGNLLMANLVWQALGEAPVEDPFNSADAEVRAKVKVRNELQRTCSEYRNVVLVRRMLEDAQVDPADFAAADRWLDKWLEGERSKPYYLGEKAWVDGYRKGRSHVRETHAKIDALYGELAGVPFT